MDKLVLKKEFDNGQATEGWEIGKETEVVFQCKNYVYVEHPLYKYLTEPFTYNEIEEHFERVDR